MNECANSSDSPILNEHLAFNDGFDDSLVPQLGGASLASYCAAAAFVLSCPRDEWLATDREISKLNWLPRKKKSKPIG
jgi:hypothetical protein